MDFSSSSFDVLGRRWNELDNYEDFPGHLKFNERLRKTLYYGSAPNTDQPSLPVTDVAVELFQSTSSLRVPHRKTIDKLFAAQVSRMSSISPCAFMLSMVYIERMKRRNPEYIEKISSADLFLVSMMVASKYLYDEGEEEEMYNDEWADAADIDVDTVNEMELGFLAAIDWNLFINPDEFFEFLHKVETRIAIQEGNKRGWFSYTDLLVLLEEQNFHDIFMNAIGQTVQVASVCVLMYGMCAATMIGSSAIVLQSSIAPASTRTPVSILEPLCLMAVHYSGTADAKLSARSCVTHGQDTHKYHSGFIMLLVPSQDLLVCALSVQYEFLMQCVELVQCCLCSVLSALIDCVSYGMHQSQLQNATTQFEHIKTCSNDICQTSLILPSVHDWHITSSMNILQYPALCLQATDDRKLPSVQNLNFSHMVATSSQIQVF